MKSSWAQTKPSTVVKMVRWFMPSGPRWSKWHLTQTEQFTWCGKRFRNGIFPVYTESQIKDWRGERTVCGLCIRHLESQGTRKGGNHDPEAR